MQMPRLTLTAAALGLLLSACVPRHDTPLYDTHAHFFSSDIARYPLDTRGYYRGEAALRDRILHQPNTPETVLPAWRANGVEGGVGVQYWSAYKADNRFLQDVRRAVPGQVAAVVILNPDADASPAMLAQMARSHGVRGIRFSGTSDPQGGTAWLDGTGAQRLWDAADRLGQAVVVMPLPAVYAPTTLRRVRELATQHPRTPIILDHAAWAVGPAPDFGLTALHEAIGDRSNVYLKLTTLNVEMVAGAGDDPAAYVRRAADLFGARRLMWGSDFGNSAMPFAEMVRHARASAARLTRAERRSYLYATGRRIFHRTRRSRRP